MTRDGFLALRWRGRIRSGQIRFGCPMEKTQTWSLLPRLPLGYCDLQSIGTLADSSEAAGTHAPWGFQPIPPAGKPPQPVGSHEFNCFFFHVDGCRHAPYILTFASRTAENVREALQQDPAVTKIVPRMYLMDRRLSPFGQLWSSGLFVFASHVWTGNMSAPRKARLEIPLGLLCSTTGTYGSVGQSMLNGALLAIEQVGSDARYDFAFTPVAADPGGELARYFSLSQQFLTDAVSHVIGSYTPST